MIDRSSMWIGLCDMSLAMLAVIMVAVNPPKKAESGAPEKAWFLVTVDWDVSQDVDVDNWLVTPTKKPAFYQSRDVGCARLDTDSRGFLDGQIRLADGSVTQVQSYKETIQLRCVEPGHYEFGANLYSDRRRADKTPLKVHAEIAALNPAYHVVFAKDVDLHSTGETANLTGFDLSRDGEITLTDPPLASITETYQRMHAAPGTP